MGNTKKKYIYIAIAALITILILVTLFFIFQNKKVTYHTITASDGSFQISFPSNIPYQANQKENNEFVIDLYSTKDEMFFYATKIAKSREINLSQIVNDDKENYLKEKQNIRDDSGVVSSEIQNYTVYEYHFVYNDASYGKDFYSHVIWIETESNLYVLNFEIVNENKEKFLEIFEMIKGSFVEL